jgi:hypothetical protein
MSLSPTTSSSVLINNSHPSVDWGGPPVFEEDAENLSPDALMSYCQTRLDSIDGQVRGVFEDQQQNASITQQIDQVIGAIKQYDGSDQTDPTVCKNLETIFHDLIENLKDTDPNCPVLPELTQAYNSMVWSGDGGAAKAGLPGPDFIDFDKYSPTDQDTTQGDMKLGTQELQKYVDTLTDAAGNLNSSSELGMVQIQSLMAQRQTAVTLTTNLVQSLGDQESKIADNIGH